MFRDVVKGSEKAIYAFLSGVQLAGGATYFNVEKTPLNQAAAAPPNS